MKRNGLPPLPIAKQTDIKRKGSFICTFCFGSNCRVEDWTRCVDPIIKGLHSNIVSGVIIASARLSNRKIKEWNLIEQLKALNVVAVFNLEEPGEHPICGDRLVSDKIGFSYDPEIVNNAGIAYFNSYWQDLQITSYKQILMICQQIDSFV